MNPPPDKLRDIAPPVDFFPYPLWVVILAGVAALGVLVLLGLLIRRWMKNRPAPEAPAPRAIALAALEDARRKVGEVDPYAFSILVSDVLRGYVSEQFNLPATRRTSPEFLADVARSTAFSGQERTLLKEFLEAADLIKFARVDAGRRESEQLLEQAIRFVKGEARELVQ